MTEQFLKPDSIQNIFGDDLNVSYQYYSEQVQKLHHTFLRSQLTGDQLEIDIEQLIQFNQDAEFISKEFTNPLVVEHIEGLPKDKVPTKQLVQDALALAGTLFEYLGDIRSILGDGHTQTDATQRLQSTEQYYLKSGLCYALGRYEARTHIMLRRVVSEIQKPSDELTISNCVNYANYAICSLIARDFFSLKRIQKDNEEKLASLRDLLLEHASRIGNSRERFSKRELLNLNYALNCLEACFDAAFALMDGESSKLTDSDRNFKDAIESLYQLGNFEQLWVIRTLQKVIHRMWDASPWELLSKDGSR